MEIRHPGWIDELEDTKYPFADTATLDNGAGAVMFNRTFLDAVFYLFGARPPVYLRRVFIGPQTIEISVSDESGEDLARASFDSRNPPERLDFVDKWGRRAGVMVTSPFRLAAISAWGKGEHLFEPEHTAFVASVLVPVASPYGVEGFLVPDNKDIVAGDVWLVGDNGVVLACEPAGIAEDGKPIHRIVVHAVGDPLFRRKLCGQESSIFQTPRFVQQICFSAPGMKFEESSSITRMPENADILWLSDTTGSMSIAIEAVQSIAPEVAQQLSSRLAGVTKVFWAAAEYKDISDEFTWRINHVFTDDVAKIQQAMRNWHASGGGDWPEAQAIAFTGIAQAWETGFLGRPASDTVRVIIWIGDAPGWDRGAYPSFPEVKQKLQDSQIVVLALNVYGEGDGIDEDREGVFPKQATFLSRAVLHEAFRKMAEEITSWIVDHLFGVITGGSKVIVPSQFICCGPGKFGDIKIIAGHRDNPKTTLRLVPVFPEGLLIEAVGERLPTIRG